MKKILCAVVLVLILLFLAACAGPRAARIEVLTPPLSAPPFDAPLLFNNVPQRRITLFVTPAGLTAFSHDLTDEELEAVFPYLAQPLQATAHYGDDGSFLEVGAQIPLSEEDLWQWARIWVGTGAVFQKGSLWQYVFDENGVQLQTLEESEVHGVPVTVILVEGRSTRRNMVSFQADFTLDDFRFRVRVEAYKEAGMVVVTELVNKLVLGGTEGLAVLAEPATEYPFGDISLEEAYLDPRFGGYLPVNVPERFYFESAERRMLQFNDLLYVEWSMPLWDQAYIEARVAENPWAASAWNARRSFISWRISAVEDIDRIRTDIVSADERQRYDWSLYPIVWQEGSPHRGHDVPPRFHFWPIFLSEELTLAVVEAREWERAWVYQVREGDDSMEMSEFFDYVLHSDLEFGVLFEDVLVRVHAVGVTSEEVWGMFAQLLP